MKSAPVALAALLGLSIGNTPPQSAMSEADAVRSVLPSVVNISVWRSGAAQGHPNSAARMEEFYGTGFIIDSSGLVLTNRHVVDNADDVAVTFSDGTRADATLCATSGVADLAVVKVQGRTNLPPVRWGDSNALAVGEHVLAIGNPFGVGTSVSAGIVSALHRHLSASATDDFIQTDAAINHGNSGGVLVDPAGGVVGINTKFLSDRENGGSLGVGFAIPSQEAIGAMGQLRDCNHRTPGLGRHVGA